MTSQWRHHLFDFYEIRPQIDQGYSKATYRISFWLYIRELRYKVGKLTENYEEKWVLRHCDLDLWPKVTNFNRVRVSAVNNFLAKNAPKSVHLFGWNFVHKQSWTDTHTHTDRHTDKLEWKYNPFLWRCKNHLPGLWKLVKVILQLMFIQNFANEKPRSKFPGEWGLICYKKII